MHFNYLSTLVFPLSTFMKKSRQEQSFPGKKKTFRIVYLVLSFQSCPLVTLYALRKEISCNYLSFNDLQKEEKR